MQQMTSREDTPPQIYIPTLLRELIDRPVPDGVLFFDPGLPATAGNAAAFTPGNYPLSRQEAAQVLTDLLSIGEAFDLANPKNISTVRESFSESGFSSEEKRDLAKFASPGAVSPEHAPASPLIAAQKVVLLAWDLETRLSEIHSLRQEVAKNATPLADALRDAAGDFTTAPSVSDFLPEIPDNAEPDWRLTLAAMAAFLPENAILVTAHEDMSASLLELGMLLPLPEYMAQTLANWPESVKASLLWVKAPLWRVIGHTKAPENAPWLASAPEIIVCRQAQTKRGAV
jgi:hypothetical protein